jgi:hypothetical protein
MRKLGAALKNFPARKQKKFWFHVRKKKPKKKVPPRTQTTNAPTPFCYQRWAANIHAQVNIMQY